MTKFTREHPYVHYTGVEYYEEDGKVWASNGGTVFPAVSQAAISKVLGTTEPEEVKPPDVMFTRESPAKIFEVDYYLQGDKAMVVNRNGSSEDDDQPASSARAIHKLMGMKESGWQWEDESHTSAKCGSWVVKYDDKLMGNGWYMTHIDFPRSVWEPSGNTQPYQVASQKAHVTTAMAKLDEFVEWAKDNGGVWKEPKGLGAVVRIFDSEGACTYTRCLPGDELPWVSTDGTSEGSWAMITNTAFKIKVLSEGVLPWQA